MQLRYRRVLPLVAVCLALAIAPALAAKPAPTPVTPQGGFIVPPVSGINGASSVCQLGQVGPGVGAYQWFFPSDDYYYTIFDPTECGCPAGVTNLVAHWQLYWPTPCHAIVQAWIVPAVDVGGGCFVPDAGISPPDPTNWLCGPTAVTALDGTAGGLIDHSIALPPCNCLASGQKVAVLFKIVSPGDCPIAGDGSLLSPTVVVDASPDACTSYNAYPGSGGPVDMLSFGFPGNMVMYVEADCCLPTPTLPGSWGMLKTLYR